MKKFYVYAHMDEDEIVYIGLGRNDRAWVTGCRRNQEHKDFMNERYAEGDSSFVVLLEQKLSEDDAKSLEKRLIQKEQPKYNREYTESHKQTMKEISKKAVEVTQKAVVTPMGKFSSITKAAEAHKAPQTTISYRCRTETFEDYYYV
jgi:hypothetical protein